jgi:hypothetical protein
MYSILRKILPDWAANVVIVAWYLMLAILIYLLWFVPQGEFRYLHL